MTCAYCAGDHPAFGHGPLVLDDAWDGVSDYPFLPPGQAPSWPSHTLSDDDAAMADRYARDMDERGKRRKDRLDTASLLKWRISSARAEVAFSRLTGLPWHADPRGFSKPDVGQYQVRWSGQGRLKVSDHDPAGDPVVLMIGGPMTFTCRGWIVAASVARQPEYWENPHNWGGAWWVPPAHLDDPWTIPELAHHATLAGVR